MYKNAHGSFIHDSKKLEIGKVLINGKAYKWGDIK